MSALADPPASTNVIYDLRDLARHLTNPECVQACRKAAELVELSHQADDALRRDARRLLPANFSPTLIPEVEELIRKNGDELRLKIFGRAFLELSRAVDARCLMK